LPACDRGAQVICSAAKRGVDPNRIASLLSGIGSAASRTGQAINSQEISQEKARLAPGLMVIVRVFIPMPCVRHPCRHSKPDGSGFEHF